MNLLCGIEISDVKQMVTIIFFLKNKTERGIFKRQNCCYFGSYAVLF